MRVGIRCKCEIGCSLLLCVAVILAVNSVLASGMSWEEVKSLIKTEAEQGNPVAGFETLSVCSAVH